MQHLVRFASCSLLLVFAAPLYAQSATLEYTTASTPAWAGAAAPTAASTAAPQAPLAAESAAAPLDPATPAVVDQSPTASAQMTDMRAGVHAAETSRAAVVTMAPAHANLGESRALMIVGAAGVIVGAIIGGTPGTVIMVGGALVGLKGLYDYLQ